MGRLDCRWVPSTLNYVCLTSSSTYVLSTKNILPMLYNVLTYLCMHRSYLDTLDSISASGGVAKKWKCLFTDDC